MREAIAFFQDDERIAMPLSLLARWVSIIFASVSPLTPERWRISAPQAGGTPCGTARSAGALLIFDEPTTGLHFDDVARLLKGVLHRLVDEGKVWLSLSTMSR